MNQCLKALTESYLLTTVTTFHRSRTWYGEIPQACWAGAGARAHQHDTVRGAWSISRVSVRACAAASSLQLLMPILVSQRLNATGR